MVIHQLRYFVALAEEKSYSNAAKRLFVSQPSISKGVKWLENEMDLELVSRGGAQFQLTPAGECLYRRAKTIVAQVDGLKDEIASEMNLFAGELRIGYLTYGYLNAITGLMKSYRKRYPAVKIRTEYVTYEEAKRKLRSREIDCFLVSQTEVSDVPESVYSVFHHSRMMAIIPKSNTLSRKKSVAMEELREEWFVFYGPDAVPILMQATIDLCRSFGFEPKIAGYGSKMAELVAHAQMYDAIAISDDTVKYVASDAVSVVPIRDAITGFDLCVVYGKTMSSMPMKALARMAEAYAETEYADAKRPD